MEEPDLFVGFQEGKQEALRTVYLHYAPQLYSYLRKGFSFSSGSSWYRVSGIQDPVEQENLVQDTFVRCFEPKVRASYDGKRPFFPYVQRICRNLFLGEKRKHWRECLEEQPQDEADPSEEMTAQEQLEHQELLQLLHQFLQRCSERERQVFEVIYEHGLSQQQAAEELGLGRTQIRTTLTNLRKGLLRHLRDSGYLASLQSGHVSLQSFLWLSPSLSQILCEVTRA